MLTPLSGLTGVVRNPEFMALRGCETKARMKKSFVSVWCFGKPGFSFFLSWCHDDVHSILDCSAKT